MSIPYGTLRDIANELKNIRWILERKSTTEQSSMVGEWIAKDGVFYCSRCGNDSAGLSEEDVDVYEMTLPNYCQDCGAKMKG